MPATYPRRVVVALWVTVALLVIVVGWLTVSHFLSSLRLAFAEDQTAVIQELRAKALRAEPREAAELLDAIVNYYSSGTKQVTGSRLGGIVERARAQAVADVIAHLRHLTGDDLGDGPRPWVEKYAGH